MNWQNCMYYSVLITLFAISFDQSTKLSERPIDISWAPGFHVLDMTSVQIVVSIDETPLQKVLEQLQDAPKDFVISEGAVFNERYLFYHSERHLA